MTAVQESINPAKLMTAQALELKICTDKGKQKHAFQARFEQSGEQLLTLKRGHDRELTKNLETRLVENLSEFEAILSGMGNTKSAYLDSVRTATLQLDNAKEVRQKVSLRNTVENLISELDNMNKEHVLLKEKESETESIANDLRVKLQKAKYELEEAFAAEAKIRGASDEMIATFHQLVSECENAKHEAEGMKEQAEELKREAEASQFELEEAEIQLRVTLHEAEEARAAEARALDQIKILSEKTDAARASTSETGAPITISRDEFEPLSWKVEECKKLAEMRVAAVMAQAEAVKASENESLERIEVMQKEIEDMKIAAQVALKKAEMAEAAKNSIAGELRRWHEREQKKTAEVAARVLAETEKPFEPSPHNYQYQKPKPQEKAIEMRKFEKTKTSVAKKVLMPVFHKKKNQIEGSSHSYLPGEKSVW